MASDHQHFADAPLTGRRLTRWVTLRYGTALVAIALLAVGSHLVLEHAIDAQATVGAQVNVAGRQRMLSQRIAAQALAHSAGIGSEVPGGTADGLLADGLRADADEMGAAQRSLLAGDAARNLPGDPSPALQRLYRDGEGGGVEQAVDRYTGLARVVARTPPGDAELPALVARLLADSRVLLPELDGVVDAYQAEGEAQVAATTRTSSAVVGLTLAVLLAEALLVFAPLTRRLRTTVANLEATAARLRTTVDTAVVGVVSLDCAGLVTDVNDALLTLLGSTRERVLGTPLTEHVDPATAATLATLTAEAAAGGHRRVQQVVLTERHRPFTAELTASTTPPDRRGERSTVVVVTDVTERHAAEQVLVHRAQHDQLTGLPNRTVLAERLVRAATRSRTAGTVALLVLDLDGFKAVNDEHGHAAGDAVLVAVARRARAVLREGDTVARFGGDEFVVLLEEVESVAGVLVVAQRLATALREPVEASGVTVSTGVSIGVTLAATGPPGSDPPALGQPGGAGSTGPAGAASRIPVDVGRPDLQEMLCRADLAMYATKRAGDERPRIYHAGLRALARAHALPGPGLPGPGATGHDRVVAER